MDGLRRKGKSHLLEMPGTILNFKVDEDICAVLNKTYTVHGQRYVDT